MVGIVLVSENKEGSEMLKAARRLLGRTRGMTSVILKPESSITCMTNTVKRAMKKVDTKKGVLILVDFFGSSQCNVCRKFVKKGSVEMLTGVNLPILVKLGTLNQTMAFNKLVPYIAKYGKDHICHIKSRRPKLNQMLS